MAFTQIFRSGNSQAVRIPANWLTMISASIWNHASWRRHYDLSRPRDLKDAVAALRKLPKPSEVEKREPIEVPDRE